MRAIWSGAITFGLVNVPVKLYSATEDHDVELHQVHDADGGRIRYQRRCEVCGEIVDYKRIAKAHVDDEQTVVLSQAELDAIPQERDREISVVEFVPTEQIDPLYFERSYYLRPSGKTMKAYVLLRRTLEQTKRTAVVQFALRQKTRLAALRVRENVLVLQTLLWPDELRKPAFAEIDGSGDGEDARDTRVRISAKEMQLSTALVKSFSDDFDPSRFRDEYQEQLRQLIDAKRLKGDAIDTDETFGDADQPGGEVIDLMEALKRSVQRSRSQKRAAQSSTKAATKAATGRSAAEPSKSARSKSAQSKSARSKKTATPKKSAKSAKPAKLKRSA